LRQYRPQCPLRTGLRCGRFFRLQNHTDYRKTPRRVPRGDFQPDQSYELCQPGNDILLGQLRPDHVDPQRRVGAGSGIRRTPRYATRLAADRLVSKNLSAKASATHPTRLGQTRRVVMRLTELVVLLAVTAHSQVGVTTYRNN